MSDSFDHIYLSPHLDDAVFSCGGTIALQRARGERVLVVTVCAGVPSESAPPPPLLAEGLDALGITAAELVRHRLAEDRAAMAVLGVSYEWKEELDAIFRMPGHYGTLAGLLGPIADGDPLVPACRELARRVAPGAMLYAPLGVGEHVDHRIVCDAALSAGRPVLLYEDFPYAMNDVHALQRRASTFSLTEELSFVDRGLELRIDASEQYRSQLRWMESLKVLVPAYAKRVGNGEPAERFFRPS